MLWQRWILPTVQEKRSVACRYIGSIVCGKFCNAEALAPYMRVQFDIRPQEVFQHTNCHLVLPVCLWVKRCAESEIRSKYLEKLCPEPTGEPWIPI